MSCQIEIDRHVMSLIRFALCSALAISAISVGALAGNARQAAAGGMPSHPAAHPHAPASDAHDHDHGAAPGKAQSALRTVPERPRARERAELTFTLADGSGQPVQQLMTHHDRKLHVLIVSDDMQVFGHIHPHDFPEPIEGGEAKVFFTFPRAGRYLAATDFMTEAGPQGVQFLIDVAGSEEPTAVAGKQPLPLSAPSNWRRIATPIRSCCWARRRRTAMPSRCKSRTRSKSELRSRSSTASPRTVRQ